MGKQTMGTACHNWHLQSETKLYRIQTPATPLFRPVHYDTLSMDDFAMGSNAVIAVISYTVKLTMKYVVRIFLIYCNFNIFRVMIWKML